VPFDKYQSPDRNGKTVKWTLLGSLRSSHRGINILMLTEGPGNNDWTR